MKLKAYFQFDNYQAVFKKEIIGGLSTFLAMVYIMAVNPAIVGNAPLDPNNPLAGSARNFQGGLFLATAISAFLATMFMGLYARVPVALAPGMGLNGFFAFTVAAQIGFESALTATILSGLIYFFIVITPARQKIASLIPANLKLTIGVAIGFFIGYIGLQNSQIIVADGKALATQLGDLGHPLVILAVCLLVIGLILHYAKVPGAIVLTMVLGAIILIPIIMTNGFPGANPQSINPAVVGYQGFSTFGNVIQSGWKGFANPQMWKSPITYVAILSFLYVDFFDTTGMLITIDKSTQLSKHQPKWLAKACVVDAISTFGGASLGASTVQAFSESVVGISAGAKTGFSAIVTALCLGATIALWPIMQIFMPVDVILNDQFRSFQPITGPVLIIVGAIMIEQIKHFEWKYVVDIPVFFVTIVLMMLTNSIAYGLGFSTLAFVFLNGALGFVQTLKMRQQISSKISVEQTSDAKAINYWKRLNWGLLIIALISLVYLILQTGIFYHNWFK